MHVHNNQLDPNLQLGVLYAAARAEANKEAERTRRKLLDAAVSNEYEDAAVVSLSGEEDSQQHANQRDPQEDPQEDAKAQPAPNAAVFSDWA
jgi:hypothetical protein